MRVSTKRILSILVGLAFLLGAFGVYISLIRGAVTSVETTRGLLASKESLLANQERAVSQVKGLIDEFKNFAELQGTVDQAIPNGPGVIQALRQIEAIGRTSNTIITDLDFSTPAPSTRTVVSGVSVVKKLRTLEVKARVAGSYEGLKQFAKLLETGVRVADVKRLSYAPAGGSGSSDTVSVEVTMYYQE